MNIPESSLPIFFIVGRGRSGSTLLRLMLDAHPNILVPTESRFFIFLYKKYAHRKKWNPIQLEEFYTDLFLEEHINFIWEIDRKKLKQEILAQPENTSFAILCKIVYSHYISFFEKGEICLIGDKNPINSLFIEELFQVFPEAKFIHLIRDPRATCLSHLKVGLDSDVTSSSLMWVEYNRAVEIIKSKVPDQYFRMFYEDLVRNPKENLQKVTQFLKVNYTPSMLNYYRKAGNNAIQKKINAKGDIPYKIIMELYHKFHQNTSKPVNTKSLNIWRKKLSSEQIKMIEGICVDQMKEYGYELVFDSKKHKKPIFFQLQKHFFRKKIIRLYHKTPLIWRTTYTGMKFKLLGKMDWGR